MVVVSWLIDSLFMPGYTKSVKYGKRKLKSGSIIEEKTYLLGPTLHWL